MLFIKIIGIVVLSALLFWIMKGMRSTIHDEDLVTKTNAYGAAAGLVVSIIILVASCFM